MPSTNAYELLQSLLADRRVIWLNGNAMTPTRGYLLCSIQRTGSNLLEQALSGTGIAGRPLEYFNPFEQEKPWMREILGDSTIVDGIPEVLRAGTTPNGVFGAKTHWNHFRYLGMSINGEWNESARAAPYFLLRSQVPNLLSEGAACELLESRFSDLRPHATAYTLLRSFIPDLRVVWMKRKNMVARAISHFRALQTGLWSRPLSNHDQVPGERVPDLDLAEIHNLYCLGVFHQKSWQRFFEEQGISPHCVFYEELLEDYEPTVRRVLEFLGGDSGQALIPPPRSAKQSDALSGEWEERYRKLKAEAGI
jgi:trehalose 2-sulfotransferase